MALADSFKSLQELDLSELDLQNIGSWPLAVKVIAWILAFILVLVLGYYFVISDVQNALKGAQQREQTLKQTYEKKAEQAANLDAYRQQMKEIEKNFAVLLGQLPEDTEVPGLLDDISNIGVKNGLRFQTIKLLPEKQKEFYVELPIDIEVTGSYHDFGAFVSGVSSLPRIVTLHDFDITRHDKKGGGGSLDMKIMAKTYRYKGQ